MFSSVQVRGAVPVSGHSASPFLKEIWIFGGIRKTGNTSVSEPSNDIFSLNADGIISCHTPTVRGDLPLPRSHHSAIILDNKIFVFGGRLKDGSAVGDLWCFDIDSLSWSHVEVANPPAARFGHTVVDAGNGKFIVYGGTDQSKKVFDDDYIFDTATNQWSELSSQYKPSSGRYFHTATRIDKKIFYFGGFDEEGNALGGPRVYDLDTNEWDAANPLMDDPSWGQAPARGEHSATLINGKILVIAGGRTKSNEVLRDLYLLDTDVSTWQHMDLDDASSVFGHSATSMGHRVLLYGGSSAFDDISELPLRISTDDQILTTVAQFMHDNNLAEGTDVSRQRKPKSKLRIKYEQERAARIRLQARSALLENKLANRTKAKQLSLELLSRQITEKDLEIAELKKKNELLRTRFQATASSEEQLKDMVADLFLLWNRHEDTRRMREEALLASQNSELKLSKQFEKFSTVFGVGFLSGASSKKKDTASNAALITISSKRGSTDTVPEEDEKSEEYMQWLSSFNEKMAKEKKHKITESASETRSMEFTTPANKKGMTRKPSEIADSSPRSSSGSVSSRSLASSADRAPMLSSGKECTSTSDLSISVSAPAGGKDAVKEPEKKKDKKTLSEQFLAGKATFSRRFSAITGKAKALLSSASDKDKAATGAPGAGAGKVEGETEAGIWKPPASPAAVKSLPLSLEIVERCLAALQPHVDMEGIFRMSGIADQVRAVYAKLDPPTSDLTLEENPHNVSSAFKLYLRELAEPLIPFKLYSKVTAAVRKYESTKDISELKGVFVSLPKLNSDVLKKLMSFLIVVAGLSSKNRMDPKNLGIVFGPTLLRPEKETLETMMSDTNVVNSFTALVMDNMQELFVDVDSIPSAPSTNEDRLTSSTGSASDSQDLKEREKDKDKKKRRKDKS